MIYEDNEISAFWEKLFGEHHERVMSLCEYYPEKNRIEFSYEEMCSSNEAMAEYVCNNASRCLRIGENYLKEEWRNQLGNRLDTPIHIGIRELPKDRTVPISGIRVKDNGKLVAVRGIVRKLSSVSTVISNACYRCSVCGSDWYELQESVYCSKSLVCKSSGCKGKGLSIKLDKSKSKYIDYQEGEIQECPEGLSGRRQPQSMLFVLKMELVSKLTVGAKVTMNSIVKIEDKRETDDNTIAPLVLEVNSIEADDTDMDEVDLTDDIVDKVMDMSKNPNIIDDIAGSIATTIYGFE